MRTTSLAALFGSVLFMFSGCIDNPGTDDDDTTVGDDDDATVFEDVTLSVSEIVVFMGYDGNGTSEGNNSLGYEYPEFGVMVADSSVYILLFEGTVLEDQDIVFPGDGTTVHFAGTSNNYVHAPCSGKVIDEGQVLITVNHAAGYLDEFPEFETDDVEDHRDVSFVVNAGESISIPVNYDASGNWTCWLANTEFNHNISHSMGERFGQWFTEVQMLANGHYFRVEIGGSLPTTYSGTVSADGNTFTGTKADDFDTFPLNCEKN